MAYELQRVPVDPRLAEVLGADACFVEMSYGAVRKEMARAPAAMDSAEYLAAACIHVNGQPLGIEGLRAIPGRFTKLIAQAIEQTIRLHGMQNEEQGDDAGKAQTA